MGSPHRKSQRFLLIVVDHDSGRLVWTGKDRTAATLRRFFDDLGADRAHALTHVSADGAEWIHAVVTQRAPQAVVCLDAFHVVAWATAALDAVRRRLAAGLRRTGRVDQAATIKHTRWALLKTPRPVTSASRWPASKPTMECSTGPTCSEQLRMIFQAELPEAKALLGS